ncbi:MAG: type II toxin-antitoxin system VapC family toxin [Desulfuromonadaceae bacterium]|nr:type II toxin-antitoxin system VapC family toxin [Desulfuromonadaceae bacterium]
MILYLDTSSLAKLYVEEAFSQDVRECCAEAHIIATSRVAYPELLSALTRRYNTGDFDKVEFESLVSRFTTEWGRYVSLDIKEIHAGELARKHGIRGFDAIHLASAFQLTTNDQTIEVVFSSFDKKLNEAAKAEGFAVLTVGI